MELIILSLVEGLHNSGKLPRSITEVIQFHYTPQSASEFPVHAAIINVANFICHQKGLTWWNQNDCSCNDSALQILRKIKPDIDENWLAQIGNEVDGKLEEIDKLMKVIS